MRWVENPALLEYMRPSGAARRGKKAQKLNQESKQTKGCVRTGIRMYSNHSDLGKEFRLTGQLGWTRLFLGQKSNNAEFSRSLNTNYKGQKLEHWKRKTKEKAAV